jgi:hypothetical protein
VKLLNQVKIPGTLYQLKKFAIISNKSNLLLSAQVCLARHTNLLNCLTLHCLNIKNNITNQANQANQKYFYLGNLQVTLLNQVKIPGTLYQLKKFAIISNKDVDISEKDFIDKQLGNGQILALSLDDYALNSDKKYTNLHVVFNIEPM